MKEQFDKKLVDKIKASFDNHKEEYDPQQWEKLSSTYFASKSGVLSASYLYWIAAAFVAIIGLSVLFFQTDFDTSEERQLGSTTSENKNSELFQPEPPEENVEENTSNSLEDRSDVQLSQLENLTPTPPKTPSREVADNSNNLPPNKSGPLDNRLINSERVLEIEPERIASLGENKSHDSNVIEQFTSAGKDAEEKILAQIQKQNEEKEALASIKDWLGEDEAKNAAKDTKVLNPLRLGLLVTPQTTTSSNQAMNLGAGIMSEISLSSKFKIDLGVAYASQNLNPSASGGNGFASADATVRSAMFTNNFINTTSELRFGQLEIPLNLKYKVMDKALSGIYLMSGISNMFYINQQNIVTYNTANIQSLGLMSADAMVQTFTETQTPNSTTDGGNIGQLINFGFGYERSLSGGTFISIEPFYKMSLGTQTFINQQFSIGGINLRMNFQLKNK